jgi:hypothetical protein
MQLQMRPRLWHLLLPRLRLLLLLLLLVVKRPTILPQQKRQLLRLMLIRLSM